MKEDMNVHESDRSSEKPRPPSNHAENNDGSHGSNRHGKSKSSWGLSTAVHAVHGVGFVAKKVINNRYTDSFWHSRKGTSSASVGPTDASDITNAKRENLSHESVDHHTSQSSLNAEDEDEIETTPLKGRNGDTIVTDQFDNLKPRDGSHDCAIGSDVVDRPENINRTDGSYVKQNRWPSSSTSGSNVVDHLGNPKPSASSHVRQNNQHRWPGTVGSNVLSKSINHAYEACKVTNVRRTSFPKKASKRLPESSNDAINLPSSDDGRLKIDKFIESQPSSPNNSTVLASRGVSPSCTSVLTPARDSPSLTVTGVNPSPASLAPTNGLKPYPIVRGVSLTPASKSSRDTITTTRGVSPTPTRGASPTPTRGVSPTPTRGASPTPTRGASPTPTRGVGHHARDVSPTPVNPSMPSTRSHLFGVLSFFTKSVNNRKKKHVSNLKDVAQNLELLYNIQVQWQFANASAEAALDLQRETAEKSLSDMWKTTLELRDSIASKKIDIDLLILQLKLYTVLYRQMAYVDEWASIQKEHESALYATTNDLQARSLSLPITGGVKADIKGLKLIVFSTIQVLHATISCIQSTISKLEKTHFLASELANFVLHERALLDECEIFLASAAPLHIEECSLRSYLLQSNRSSVTE